MSAEDAFRAGKLDDAVAEQGAVVRAAPLDADARWKLFVLLCFAGELERAEKQLDALATRDDGLARSAVVHRALLASELERTLVFDGARAASLPPDAPRHARLRVEALAALGHGDEEGASRLVAEAVEATPPLAGLLDGEPFDGLCDLDDRFGAVLEVHAGGRYLWIPLDGVRRVDVHAPSSAIDVLWRPAEIVDASGATARVFLPSIYPRSRESANPLVAVGRETETLASGGLELARGHRRFLVARGDALGEVPLAALRSLELGG